MKKLTLLLLSSAVIGFSSCEELTDLVEETGLSNEEIIKGLKEALSVSTDTSVTLLHAVDGYYKDQAVKILLPEEAAVIFDNLNKVPGGAQLVEETILAINRAAEDAAIEAKPIFIDAITNITIGDGLAILQGHDSAATEYLHTNTYSSLLAAFSPKINTSLDKPLVGGTSAAAMYQTLVNTWNDIANASFGLLKPITQNTLGEYVTAKALNGLFHKVTMEEGRIRHNIDHQVSDLLKKVFAK